MTANDHIVDVGLRQRSCNGVAMLPVISDLADYTLVAWVMEPKDWRMVFDSSDGQSVVQHEISGITQWRTSELRNSIGVMEVHLGAAPNGAVSYTIDTTCNETIEAICTDVRETHIKHRALRR